MMDSPELFPANDDSRAPAEGAASLPTIKIIGVGGAGTNAVDRLKLDDLASLHLAAVNTDSQALAGSLLPEKVLLGASVTRGYSAGGEAELGRRAAEADKELLSKMTEGVDLVFLLASLGGGTGSGVTPVLAELAAKNGSLVIVFATLPFTFEGKRRRDQADQALAQLRAAAHAVIPLPNDMLLQEQDENASVLDAFALADTWMARGVEAISTLVLKTGLINVDFAMLRKAFTARGGKTLFGFGEAGREATAEDEAADAKSDVAEAALENLMVCPLLHTPEFSRKADCLIINIMGGPDLSMAKVNAVVSVLTSKFGSRENTVLGAHIEGSMRGRMRICVIGTTDLGARPPEKRPSTATTSATPKTGVASAEGDDKAGRKGKRRKRGESKPIPQVEFSFAETSVESRGFFEKSERNVYDGEDLDVPTFLRRGIKIPL